MARRTDTHRRTEGLRRMVAVATTAPFSWYLAGQAADAVALWMQRLALGWLVWELTGSAAWLGAISFLKFAPTMLLGLFGGVLADRFPRGGLVVAGQAVTVASALGVAVLYFRYAAVDERLAPARAWDALLWVSSARNRLSKPRPAAADPVPHDVSPAGGGRSLGTQAMPSGKKVRSNWMWLSLKQMLPSQEFLPPWISSVLLAA
ncbi:MAG: hypothetical protein EBQ99_10910 [Planctomycetes bacterium]|nr:hypothetical protein [Planctomycetota bacterium]